MAGQPRSRTETGGPLDWARHARVGVVDAAPTPLIARPRSVADTLAERQMSAMDRQAADLEMDEAEEARDERARRRRMNRLREQAEEARLLTVLERSSGSGGNDALAEVLRQMNESQQRNADRMIDLLRTRDAEKSSGEMGELRRLLTGLEARLEQVATGGAPADATGPIRQAMEIVKSVQAFSQEMAPQTPAAPEGFTREQVLRQIAIEEEAGLRRAEAAGRREDRAFAREQARREADLSRRRLEASTGMVKEYFGPVLEAILGDRAKDIIGNMRKQQEGGGAAALAPGEPERAQWICPLCQAANWSPIDVDIVPCPGCGEMIRPFPPEGHDDNHPPGGDQPHHHEGA